MRTFWTVLNSTEACLRVQTWFSASIIAFTSLHLHLSGSYTLEAECVGGCCSVAVPSLVLAGIDVWVRGSDSSHSAKIRKEKGHIENWTGLQTLRDVDMELYTGLQRLTITRSNLHTIQARVFSKNPHLRYM
ncbi:hypothetical protein VZT92_025146 [Zoarces viviparus]|uniref:Uncharacterized protein n=1 Tax=Zoarces viviparus TaxID=48416 RepID=A0AAW1E419_ZOAVI